SVNLKPSPPPRCQLELEYRIVDGLSKTIHRAERRSLRKDGLRILQGGCRMILWEIIRLHAFESVQDSITLVREKSSLEDDGSRPFAREHLLRDSRVNFLDFLLTRDRQDLHLNPLKDRDRAPVLASGSSAVV